MNGPFIISDERKAALDAEGEAMDLARDIAADLEREFPPNRKDKSMAPEEMYAKIVAEQKGRAMQDRAGASLGGTYDSAQNAAIKRTPPMDRLYQSVEVLSKAASVTMGLADALCGSEPQADGAGEATGRSGMFGSIEDTADRINRLAGAILADMARVNARSAGM